MSETAPEGLRFKYYEDIFPNGANYQNLITAFNNTDIELRSKSDTKIKNRGLKIICIENDIMQNSNADKDGIFARLNYTHIMEFFTGMKSPESFKYQNVTLCHEVGHLFGLEDRYQYLVNYSFDGACYSIIKNFELVPILVDPNIDNEANYLAIPYQNLMFGANEKCVFLTPYQLAIIWGNNEITNNRDVENEYRKNIFITLPNTSVSTFGKYMDERGFKRTGIVLGLQNNLLYTYTTNQNNQFVQNYTGSQISINGSVAGNNVNNLLGAVTKFMNGQGVDIATGNNLAQTILNNTNCNNQTIINENLQFLNSLPGI